MKRLADVGAEISYQIWMGPTHPGPWRSCSAAQLYALLVEPATAYVPPFAPLNDLLARGIWHAREHGIHIRWDACRLTQGAYGEFLRSLLMKESVERSFRQIDSPNELDTWDSWSQWISVTVVEPSIPSEAERQAAHREAKLEMELKRRYRKALAIGNAAEAIALAALVREKYDPNFS
jgi:hypothetical protein